MGWRQAWKNNLCMLGFECNKLSSGEIEGKNSTVSLFFEIISDLAVFYKYVKIYHFFSI